MPAAVWNLLIEQGATWEVVLTLTDRDLTGCTARMQVRETIESPTALLDLSTAPGSGIVVTPGPPGTITLRLSDEETAAIAWRHGVFDLELTDAYGDTDRLLKGEVSVDFEVTR
ncbi:hypothetical protein [Microbispora sp. NPDC049125]|uniref:hypothetical protein n=1 Tax=Microbispora sp. NPDC049125 TaxID=3154929 RepID=UPI0034674C21